MAVVAQHSTGTGVAVQGPCRISSWCCPPPQPPWHLHKGLQFPQQRLHPWGGVRSAVRAGASHWGGVSIRGANDRVGPGA